MRGGPPLYSGGWEDFKNPGLLWTDWHVPYTRNLLVLYNYQSSKLIMTWQPRSPPCLWSAAHDCVYPCGSTSKVAYSSSIKKTLYILGTSWTHTLIARPKLKLGSRRISVGGNLVWTKDMRLEPISLVGRPYILRSPLWWNQSTIHWIRYIQTQLVAPATCLPAIHQTGSTHPLTIH